MAHMRKRKVIRKQTLVLQGVRSNVGKIYEGQKTNSLIDSIVAQGIIFRLFPAIGALERVKEGVRKWGFEKHQYTPSTRYFAARKLMQLKEKKLRQASETRKQQFLIRDRSLKK